MDVDICAQLHMQMQISLIRYPDICRIDLDPSIDEPPGSVYSEITGTTYNLSSISLIQTFSKPNIASPAQVKSY